MSCKGLLCLAFFAALLCLAHTVSACQNISSPGNYTLAGNVSTSGTCFNITASSVTLDCQGYSMSGASSYGTYGVYAENADGLVVKNCVITGFGTGLRLSYTDNANIASLTAYGNRYSGIEASYSNNNRFTNVSSLNTTPANGNYGMYVRNSYGNIFTNLTLQENPFFDLYVAGSDASFYCDNVFRNITGSGGREIRYYNSSVFLSGIELSELVLCNADYSSISNVTIRGSPSLRNNGIHATFTDASNFSNLNNSGNYVGLAIWNGNDNLVRDAAFSSDAAYGVYLLGSYNCVLTNMLLYNVSVAGVLINGCEGDTLANTTAHSNSRGIMLDNSNRITLRNVTASNTGLPNSYGVMLQYTANSTFYNVTARNNSYGFYFSGFTYGSNNNAVADSNACPSSTAGYYFDQYSHNNSGSNNFGNMSDEGGNTGFSTSPCSGLCQTGADTSGDHAISTGEILAYVGNWKKGLVTTGDVLKAIGFWKAGAGC